MKKVFKQMALCLGMIVLLGSSFNVKASEEEYVPVIVDLSENEASNVIQGNPLDTNVIKYAIVVDAKVRGLELVSGSLGITQGNGAISVSYVTEAGRVVSEIGIINCRLQRKDSGVWKSIYTKPRSSSMNARGHMGGYSLLNPESGQTYRSVTSYFSIADGKQYNSYGETQGIIYQ